MINNVVLVGRIVREPELKYTPSNVAVAAFTLTVNRRFKNANGEREADFINCVIWRQGAENLAKWTHKGSLIGITGSIQTRSYENQQGQRIYVTEVIAEQFQVLEKRESGQQQGQSSQVSTSNQRNQAVQADPFDDSPMGVSDDDLPF
jgi:single-strand DNA-binding protein